MTNRSVQPVVAVFPTRAQAETAIDDLWHEGFSNGEVGMVAPGESLRRATTSTDSIEERGALGAAAGAVTGSGVGALVGALAVAVVPGLGTVLAGGMLAGIALGAGAGAALGGCAGPFVTMGFSEMEARQYETELRAGRTIVMVLTGDRQEKAMTVLRLHEPIWAGFAAGNRAPTAF